jgi:hypothetical protein
MIIDYEMTAFQLIVVLVTVPGQKITVKQRLINLASLLTFPNKGLVIEQIVEEGFKQQACVFNFVYFPLVLLEDKFLL